MKILVIGSGGREHALCRAFSRSEKVSKIFCADGNAGIAELAECVKINPALKPHAQTLAACLALEN